MLKDLRRTIEPMLTKHRCLMCDEMLRPHEACICDLCMQDLCYTRFMGQKDNYVERLFGGRYPIEHANALLYYHAMTDSCRIFFAFKYDGHPEVAVHFGRLMAEELLDTDFYRGIDLIIPVPLHPIREHERGYNQSLMLAQGVAAVTGLPINDTALVRTKNTVSQTGLTPKQRRENVKDAFALLHPEEVAGRHLLLIDDVVTTNATLSACADALVTAPNVRLSILTLGLAGTPTTFPYKYVPWWKQKD